MRCFLFITCLIISISSFAQRKKKIIYAPPVVKEETPPEPPTMLESDMSSFDIGVAMGESKSDAEIIAELNRPLYRDTFPEKIQKIWEGGDKAIAKIVGEENFKQYFRIHRDRILDMNRSFRKEGSFKKVHHGIYYYEIVYQSHLIGLIMMQIDTFGKPLPDFYTSNQKDLAAYKQLFEGKLTVSYEEAVGAVFGKEQAGKVFHVNLSASTIYPENWIPTQTPPKIWWNVWQNGCVICEEGKIDATNLSNQKISTVDRRKQH